MEVLSVLLTVHEIIQVLFSLSLCVCVCVCVCVWICSYIELTCFNLYICIIGTCIYPVLHLIEIIITIQNVLAIMTLLSVS